MGSVHEVEGGGLDLGRVSFSSAKGQVGDHVSATAIRIRYGVLEKWLSEFCSIANVRAAEAHPSLYEVPFTGGLSKSVRPAKP